MTTIAVSDPPEVATLPDRARPNWPALIAVTFAVVIVMNLLHEAGHAIAAKLLGYDVLYRINSVLLTDGPYRTVGDSLVVDLSGPLVTVTIAIAAWLGAKGARGGLAPTILFSALAMRGIAAAVSLGNPNDEARASLALGLGSWALFAIVILLLGTLFVSIYRRLGLGWRWLVSSYLGASCAFALLVFGEPFIPAIAF